MRILFFIGSLGAGGKERRLVELLTYLSEKGSYELLLVLAFNIIEYQAFAQLGVNHYILNKTPNFKDPRIFFALDKICKNYKPDIIHTWGMMQTFYMIPTSLIRGIPILSSEITDAPPFREKCSFSALISLINFKFAKVISANSRAGLVSYKLSENEKYRIVYNGVDPSRFKILRSADKIKKHFKLNTKYSVVMVANFTANKDYEKYLAICKYISKYRADITFYAVGDGYNYLRIKEKAKSESIDNIIFTGRINNVEELISICDLGVLFSPFGEGISNSIMEYMALGKPVVANDSGGTNEILKHNVNGYLVTNEQSIESITELILDLILDEEKRKTYGNNGKKLINQNYSVEYMGNAFEVIYNELNHLYN